MEGSIFAMRLRMARERMGFTQKRLGILIGLTPSVASPRINRYERESRQPHVTTVARISRVLKVSPSYFYEPDDLVAEVILRISVMKSEDIKNFLSSLPPPPSMESK